jgi:hypothetical protein
VIIVLKANGRMTLMDVDEITVEEFTNICVKLGEDAVVAGLTDIAQLNPADSSFFGIEPALAPNPEAGVDHP